jgi:hypothetical protein
MNTKMTLQMDIRTEHDWISFARDLASQLLHDPHDAEDVARRATRRMGKCEEASPTDFEVETLRFMVNSLCAERVVGGSLDPSWYDIRDFGDGEYDGEDEEEDEEDDAEDEQDQDDEAREDEDEESQQEVAAAPMPFVGPRPVERSAPRDASDEPLEMAS